MKLITYKYNKKRSIFIWFRNRLIFYWIKKRAVDKPIIKINLGKWTIERWGE